MPTPPSPQALLLLSWSKLVISRYLTALPSAEKLRAFLEADRERIESLMPRPAAKKAAARKRRP